MPLFFLKMDALWLPIVPIIDASSNAVILSKLKKRNSANPV